MSRTVINLVLRKNALIKDCEELLAVLKKHFEGSALITEVEAFCEPRYEDNANEFFAL